MPLKSKQSRIVLFFVFGLGLALLMAGLKAAIAWAAHTYLYSVPWLGGFLRSIELLELSNLFVFAVLGVGVGAATVWLPRRWNHRIKLAFLLALGPFVFSASYMMQQSLWVKDVAEQGNISYREAQSVTNTYLKREVGKGGFFGFFPFSTQLAELPTRLESLTAEQSVNPNELLSQELSSYDDPRADMAAYVFERVGWLIRFMYMTIAALTGLIYYFKGHSWAANRTPAKAAAATPGSTPQPARSAPRKKSSGASQGSASQRPKPSGKSSSRNSSSGRPSSGKPSSIKASSNLSNSSSSTPSGTFPSKPISKPYINSPSNMPLGGPLPKPSSPPPPSESAGSEPQE